MRRELRRDGIPLEQKGEPFGVAELDGSGEVPLSQLPSSITGGLIFQGMWDASTNTPALASGVGTGGDMYQVSVAGSTDLDGITDWKIGDFAAFDGTIWVKFDNTIPDPLLLNDGTVTTPTYSFSAETGTGFFRDATDDLIISARGIIGLIIKKVGSFAQVLFPSGDSSATFQPGLSFADEPNMGWLRAGPGEWFKRLGANASLKTIRYSDGTPGADSGQASVTMGANVKAILASSGFVTTNPSLAMGDGGFLATGLFPIAGTSLGGAGGDLAIGLTVGGNIAGLIGSRDNITVKPTDEPILVLKGYGIKTGDGFGGSQGVPYAFDNFYHVKTTSFQPTGTGAFEGIPLDGLTPTIDDDTWEIDGGDNTILRIKRKGIYAVTFNAQMIRSGAGAASTGEVRCVYKGVALEVSGSPVSAILATIGEEVLLSRTFILVGNDTVSNDVRFQMAVSGSLTISLAQGSSPVASSVPSFTVEIHKVV